jgi:hypothetical protein
MLNRCRELVHGHVQVVFIELGLLALEKDGAPLTRQPIEGEPGAQRQIGPVAVEHQTGQMPVAPAPAEQDRDLRRQRARSRRRDEFPEHRLQAIAPDVGRRPLRAVLADLQGDLAVAFAGKPLGQRGILERVEMGRAHHIRRGDHVDDYRRGHLISGWHSGRRRAPAWPRTTR